MEVLPKQVAVSVPKNAHNVRMFGGGIPTAMDAPIVTPHGYWLLSMGGQPLQCIKYIIKRTIDTFGH